MNYFKGSGMGFVNRQKQNQVIIKSLRASLKAEEVDGIVVGDQISDSSSIYNELYRYHD